MRFFAVLALACLAGCASTPQDLRGTGVRTDHTLTLPVDQAAGCLARNTENNSWLYAATTRPMPGGIFEVIVRMPEAPIFGAMYLIEVTPAGTSSKASIWGPTPGGEGNYRSEVIKGC